MKLMYNNRLKTATITATNENDRFPVTNTTHQFLEKRFQSTTTSSVITMELAENATISAIAIGFHNIDSGTYTLKDSGGSTVLTGSLDVVYETDITYFTATECRTIELELTSLSALYVGGLSVDNPLYFVYHNIDPTFSYEGQDTSSQTKGGQALGSKAKRLNMYQAILGTVTLDQKKELYNMLDVVGNSLTFFADLYDEDHEEARPVFCKLEGNGVFPKQSLSRDYSYTVVLKECR